jgi:hypothetical protein
MNRIIEGSLAVLNVPWRVVRLPYTLVDDLRRRGSRAGELPEATLAFLEEMAGRAKATIGFVMGDERLLASGQVERAKAAERLRAMAEEATAETVEKRAQEELSHRRQRANRQRTEASVKHASRASSIAQETAREKKRVDEDAARGRNAVSRQALAERVVIDATDEAVREKTATELIEADLEEVGAEEARRRAEEIEATRRANE